MFKVILVCIISICTEISHCADVRSKDSESKTNKWSLSSLNPLSWLFPDKSEERTNETRRPLRRKHLPISRRAGLSDVKGKKTYNDLQVERNIKKRRKLHPKQPGSLYRGAYNRMEDNNRFRERRRRRRRKKQEKNRNLSEDMISEYEVDDIATDLNDYEEYFYEDRSLDSIESRQHDLFTSDFDKRCVLLLIVILINTNL